MDGPTHYKAAEALLRDCATAYGEVTGAVLAMAQVHATLALVAAHIRRLPARPLGDAGAGTVDLEVEWRAAVAR